MMAIPVLLRPEGCVSVGPGEVSAGPGEVVELGLPVVPALCTVSIFSKWLREHPGEAYLSRGARILGSNCDCISIHGSSRFINDSINRSGSSACFKHNYWYSTVYCAYWTEAAQSRLPVIAGAGLALETIGKLRVNILSHDKAKREYKPRRTTYLHSHSGGTKSLRRWAC
jgi:hypothetical protein